MNTNELLRRAYAPVTKTYNELSLPPEEGLEGVGFSIANTSDTQIILRFKHLGSTDTVIRIPPFSTCDEYTKVFMGIVVENYLQFDLSVKEINRGK